MLWRTAQLRSTQLHPLEEVRAALAVFDSTLMDVVPEIYRELDNALGGDAGRRPPLAPAFLRFGSWVGGDRDGNPFITADVTARAMRIQSEQVLGALEAAVARAGRILTVDHETTPPSADLARRLAQAPAATTERLVEIAARSAGEPQTGVPALHRRAHRGHPAGCARGSLRVRRRAPRRPANGPGIPGSGRRDAARLRRAAAGDMAGTNLRLPPGRA